MTPTVRTSFAPANDAEIAKLFAAAFGSGCWVCQRHPWPAGLTYKNLTICAPCAPLARQRELMNDTTDAEDIAGMAGIDAAGAYMASIDKFDMRDLTEEELRKFNAHWLNAYAAKMREEIGGQPPF